ncbi:MULTISPECIES: LysR substrate-binding domain-containing protein [Pseudomonas]|jgi:DNA-binding transcriptional LysR family regulator|uniref:DNA-binding transcriptional regulator, LysR family n=1 Tax=Pseudomonas mandelii TaxID=75612 RepID=A0ABY0VUU1_9PSED|nr:MULTISPECIES: LysR substrate-binding domain-containing protein [Pseudomonas]PMV85709.1 LysR family transcriptional regulator [Pseudomonas sp. GW101-1A09]PMV96073.1 LysR family transcriptional regulator [Pseudomonas sp. FW306-2-2C-B10A]PMW00390.1 LysR family transcriptional regulator [Pseudomonas sp. GW460-C8]PMW04575.1 LysR family transcriptional regulator [Pseudomonas sp. MPR-TSA4]PMW14136.1 LysR family transcriptional regulator [Pseudomonas sp. GW456-11-11-14-TSB2]
MLDLELLKTFVCVVDEGSFTRAAERVHRTQSTVSQQVRKLEVLVGHPLLLRDRTGQNVTVTEHGELLIHYARRLLALSSEAVEALASDLDLEILRIGVPEDFDARRMALILAGFNRARPHARLETVSGMSTDLKQKLASGEIDIALVKREPDSGPCWAAWPEVLVWVKGAGVDSANGVLPLALFPQGCIYRQRAIRLLDVAQRPWRVAFGSHSLTGIQAAVASGLGVSVLPASAVLPEHSVCTDLPELPPTELALISREGALTGLQRDLVEFLREELAVLGN